MDAKGAFERYEQVRGRLPDARFAARSQRMGSLLEIADAADVFVFDAYGVLNVGDGAIAGAAARIADLRALGKRVFVLSNSASHTKAQMVARFVGLGFDFSADEIICSRDAALNHVAGMENVRRWGVIAPAHFKPSDVPFKVVVLGGNPADYDAVDGFLFLGAALWTATRQAMLVASLHRVPRPVVIANPDLVAPRETGLSLDPGFYGHAIADETGVIPAFLGKPFAPVFQRVPVEPSTRVVMVGDTLHTDILGGAAQGWKTVLVTDHGLFKGLDVAPFIKASGIVPDWQLGSI